MNNELWISTADVIVGDLVEFVEPVFSGSYRNARFAGNRRIVAEVLRESYGATRQQHTFTIRVLASDGAQPLEAGATTTRKGRNLYRDCSRLTWRDESARAAAAVDKHARGDRARAVRKARQEGVLAW